MACGAFDILSAGALGRRRRGAYRGGVCGRFTLQTPRETLQMLFGFSGPGPSWDAAMSERPRFNVAPTQPILTVGTRDGARFGDWAAWGLSFRGRLVINARAETAFERPVFRDGVTSRRVMVPADGFIEWKKDGRRRLPYHLTRADGRPLALGGFVRPRRDGPPTCAILTTAANEDMDGLHERMPVILSEADLGVWLDPAHTDRDALEALMEPAPEGTLARTRVSERVNKVQNDDPACLEPPSEAPAAPQLGFGFGD